MPLALLLWAGLAAAPYPAPDELPNSQFFLPGATTGGISVAMETMLDRRFHTVVRQRYDFSCGSAALATLLRFHYGIRASESSVFNGMWAEGDRMQIRAKGFSLLDMRRYLGAIGLNAEGYRVTLDQIAKTRIPGIALIVTSGYNHFVVVKGLTANEVLVGDPSRGLLVLDRKEFEKSWPGLYFVITSAPDFGRSSFNRHSQWAGVGRGPLGSVLGRPIEMDGLRLALPGPGEF
ncbi:MAG: C39 family peptidase [Sphingomonas sp.]|uniref:C39 family peptidase n=1 Tax=Sphingomonas sp. TaxID=28214 RepID=UPI001B2064E0|nr:C39 family peptidase [Sphingomonas sp.]MBO9623874.1 C39 family peptidase [Sphingomonas sp.]